ncbi:MAG: hydroxymethylpyrimidine/phosphomethylpyrimidine kinase [Oscillospiraceae bacterium]|jgi:hydroxymethylpyrimidine/phosphomethylpyrimidine kinase|nr:hydroxymethylpyrimidine/phosphomethylpyrimidine kinase [Oscillospiraceae bacterium]
MNNKIKNILIIAGCDSSGGAGIDADLRTVKSYKLNPITVATAYTRQDSVFSVEPVRYEVLDAGLSEALPVSAAVKIGMVWSAENAKLIAEKLKKHSALNVVFDPVLSATSGLKLAKQDLPDGMFKYLFPVCTLITPNIPEAEILSGIKIFNTSDMPKAAHMIRQKLKTETAILIKGGHLDGAPDDFLLDSTETWLMGEKSKGARGTGCMLSSAIAANLALGETLQRSVRNAKEYVYCKLSSL